MSQSSMPSQPASATRKDAGRFTIGSISTPTATGRGATMGITEWVHRIAVSSAPASTVLVRTVVGAVFLLEGLLKFHNPPEFGIGRFVKIGIPFPSFFAPFDGVFEIGCGVLLMLGLLTRLSAIPMIINMVVAITSTKIPMLLHDGFWKAAHEARLDFTMLLGCLFLALAGAGPISLDCFLVRRSGAAASSLAPLETESS